MDDESTTPQSTETATSPTISPPDIVYEETPVITPAENQVNEVPIPNASSSKKKSFFPLIKNILLLIILFGIGYVLSGVIRNAINTSQIAKTNPTPTPNAKEQNQEIQISTMTATVSDKPVNQPAQWKLYTPENGITRKPIDTIQFKLPDTILSPVCDGSACGSQGTYLPGGTRLTIAPRGLGQVLADFRGKIISDAGGKAFVTKQITIAGKQATDFSTENSGSTIGGYAFSAMHGMMIEVTDTLSLEINHFSPSGIKVDFAGDEKLFNEIIATLVFSGTGSTAKGAVLSSPTPVTQPITPIR